jgi:hypothetical protein
MRFARRGCVYTERAGCLAVKRLNGGPGTFGRGHGHKPQPARLLAGRVNHNIDFHDVAVSGEKIVQFVLCGGCIQIINMYFGVRNR